MQSYSSLTLTNGQNFVYGPWWSVQFDMYGMLTTFGRSCGRDSFVASIGGGRDQYVSARVARATGRDRLLNLLNGCKRESGNDHSSPNETHCSCHPTHKKDEKDSAEKDHG